MTRALTLDEMNRMDKDAFVQTLGETFEYSPWIMAAAADHRPFKTPNDLILSLRKIIVSADKDAKLTLLRSHPELAGKAAIDKTLTEASEQEQASAGLNRMTPEEYALFQRRNAAYKDKFGFPFIICVGLTTKAGIIEAMGSRLRNEKDHEFATALDEVLKIGTLRLERQLG